MFTGIIEELGRVRTVAALAEGKRLVVATEMAQADVQLGESIAINGACMTVVTIDPGELGFDVSAESLRRTTLGTLQPDDAVNLERSLRMGDRLGGHMVSGHVDGTGTVKALRKEGESTIFTLALPPELARFLIEKGSIAVDGISLTCYNCTDDRFDVAVIPHTQAHTTLGTRGIGAPVNLENDLVGKYIAKLAAPAVAAAT